MSLTNPRVYNWSIGYQEPFIQNETSPYHQNSLRAGDGHAIPFPLRLLQSEDFWRAESCRVMLLVEDGFGPRYPGVSYVMEINLSGYRRTLTERAQERMRRWVPRVPQLGPAGNAALSVMANPSPLAGEEHWTARVTLIQDCAAMQVDSRRVAVSCALQQVTVRYDAILAMH